MSAIKTEVHGFVMTVRINRPEAHNTLSNAMVERLIEVWDEVEASDEIRAVVVTGTGSSFCTGADISSGRLGAEAAPDAATPDRIGRLAMRIYSSAKPSIAAINGHAVGSGLTMTLPMDFRLVSSEAKLGFVFTQRGITPEGCSTWFLPRLVGMTAAVDWMCSGRIFTADEALARGLATAIHEPADVLDAALATAQGLIGTSAPVASAATLAMLHEVAGDATPHRAHGLESVMLNRFRLSADATEGIGAFRERRKAEFPGRFSDEWPALGQLIADSRDSGGPQ